MIVMPGGPQHQDDEPSQNSVPGFSDGAGMATWLTEEERDVYFDFDKSVANLIMYGDEETGILSVEVIKELEKLKEEKISWHGVMADVVCRYIAKYYSREDTRKDLMNVFFTSERLKRFAIVGLLSAMAEGFVSLTLGTNNIKGQTTFTTTVQLQGTNADLKCRGVGIVAAIVAQCKVLRANNLEFIQSLDIDYASDATAPEFEIKLLNSTVNRRNDTLDGQGGRDDLHSEL